MAEREIKRWVTWHGRRIPIYEGESKADVAARIKGGLKEGAKKGRDTQEKQHAANVKSKKEALDKARKKSNEKGRKWADNPTERRKQAYQKAVDDAQKASKDFSDAYDNKVKAKFHKKGESEEAANKAAKKKAFEEATARLRAKETEAHRYKTLKEHDYEELTAAEKKELRHLQSKASKGELDKKAPEKKGSKVEDVGHGLRKFQTADGRTLYKDASGHWVKKADAEARLKGSDSGKKEPKDVFEAAKMMREGDGTVTTKDKKIINAYKSNGSYGVVNNADGSSTIMSKSSDAWKKHTGASSSDKKAEKDTTKIDGATTISKKDFIDKYAEEYGMDADDFKQKGKDIKNFIIPEDDENPYIGVEYSDGTFWRYGTGRDLEVSKKELAESVGKPTQQDKDERIKQKQIANANKQKDALNSEKATESSFSKYDADKDKYCNQLKKDDVIEFEENGKTYKGRVIDGDGEIHKTLPNGAHKVTNAYTVNKLTEDGKDDYNLAGSHKVKVDPKNIKGYQSKDTLNGVSSSSNRPGKSLGEKAEDAKENAKLRTELTQEEHFKKQGQSSWEPKEGDRVSNVGYNEAKNKLFNAPAGTVIQMSNHNLGDYEGEYTKQADGSWVGSQKYKSNRRTPPTVKTADGFAMNIQGNDVKVLTGGQMKAAKSNIGTLEEKNSVAKSRYGKPWNQLNPYQKTQVRSDLRKRSK